MRPTTKRSQNPSEAKITIDEAAAIALKARSRHHHCKQKGRQIILRLELGIQ